MTNLPGERAASPLRVALIDPSLFTLPYDRALADGLRQAGHQARLFGRCPGPDDNEAGGVELVPDFYRLASHRLVAKLPGAARLGIKGADHAVSMVRVLRRLRAERPDVIHFQWLPLPVVDRFLLASFGAVAPLLLTVHDTDPFNGDPSAALQAGGFFRALSLFDGLIVHTEQGRARLLARGADPARVHLLPHGLLDVSATDAQPDRMDGEITLLLFGKIKPYKGLDVLIDAFARLPAPLRAQARLRVVGKPYMDLRPLEAQARELGVADRLSIEPRFVPDADIPALFGPGVVAVFPYREIEASGVLSIAIARARPVIASRLGNFAETVTDGVQGLLVPPGDVDALAAALARVVADRSFAAACSAAAHALAGQVPDWATIARSTVAAYETAGQRFAARRPEQGRPGQWRPGQRRTGRAA